ncbi:MAG: DUF4394 domain-containing protein [Leptolyngbyaceae cyanobacterium bins.59]|nr:DUF4394 domain-containing protein [Leptolyngbyaceae cyanobacterium bins.59]
MKLKQSSIILAALTTATLGNLFISSPGTAATIELVGLTDNNTLVFFNPANPINTVSLEVSQLQPGETLVGIDFRPRTGQLFALGSSSRVYTISETGAATLVGATAFTPGLNGTSFGVDFNPVPDAIRVVSDANQNTRLNPNTGGTGANAPDAPLTYSLVAGNPVADPAIAAVAYTNNFPGVTQTTLFGIDANLDLLVRQGGVNFPAQNPSPNSGQLFAVGPLNVDFGPTGGFDILTTLDGNTVANTAFAASGFTLYGINIDLASSNTGAATVLGTIGSDRPIIGLAARSVPEPTATLALIGLSAFAFLGRRAKAI